MRVTEVQPLTLAAVVMPRLRQVDASARSKQVESLNFSLWSGQACTERDEYPVRLCQDVYDVSPLHSPFTRAVAFDLGKPSPAIRQRLTLMAL